MKEASRTINVIISNLPDDMDEDKDLEFVVDTTELKVKAFLKGKAIPKKQINIDIEEDVYVRDV